MTSLQDWQGHSIYSVTLTWSVVNDDLLKKKKELKKSFSQLDLEPLGHIILILI